MTPRQEQRGAEHSANLQAGRDIVYHGLSASEIREIALGVFKENFLELRGVAEEVALGRAEKITNEFLERLAVERPAALSNFQDPDIQRALFAAQREYACSGDEDLGQVLVDLLIDRADRTMRDLQTLALNEAINAVPKLTDDQRRAIAAIFIARYTRFVGALNLDAFYELHVRRNMAAFAGDLPRKQSAYQHIEYVGAGTMQITNFALEAAFTNVTPGLFTRGLEREQIPDELAKTEVLDRLFVPCIRDTTRLQVAAIAVDDVPALAVAAGVPEAEDQLRNLLNTSLLTPDEVRDEVTARVPELLSLFEAWNASPLPSMTLTTIGLAIGHAYWQRVTGARAELGIWL